MKRIILATLCSALLASPALADNYSATAGSGLTFGAKNIGGILYPWFVQSNSAGTEIFTSGAAAYVQFPSAQAVTLSSTTITGWGGGTLGAMANYGTSPGAVLVPGVNAAITNLSSLATNALQTTGNTTLSSILTALGSPFQAGGSIANTTFTATQATGTNLHIVCDSGCSGSGGTASSFSAAFPATGTAAGAEYLSSPPTLTSGQMVAFQVTSAGSLHTTVDNVNANGSATSANSSPVVIASDQAAVAIKAASAAIASGAFASGSIGSGAVASGAFASGALASGSIASGAIAAGALASGAGVDGWNITEGAKADTACANSSATCSIAASLKGILGATQGPLPAGPYTASAAASHASTTALGTSLIAKASAGNLYGYNCTGIAGGAAGYCIVYNGTTAPGTGALTGANVLDFCYFDTTARGCSLSRIPLSINYGTGIVVLLSSAASPYTYTTGTDTGAITVDYE